MKICQSCKEKIEVLKPISWGATIDEEGLAHYYHFDCEFKNNHKE